MKSGERFNLSQVFHIFAIYLKGLTLAHPYPEADLPTVSNALGKAFDFADKHLPGGLEAFYELFVNSSAARTFDGPDAHPDLSGSGIQLVLSVCESSSFEGLDLMFMSERKPSKSLADRARWCGQTLAYHQWDTGNTFRGIAIYLSIKDLFDLFDRYRVASPRVVSLHITETLAQAVVPTRLRSYRAEAGMTQAALAKSSGVSLRSIQQYEQRKKDINHAQARSVWNLAKALDCRMEDLLEL